MLSFLRTRSSAAPTESEALSSLRAALSEAGVGPSAFLSDACLLRYLRARGLDVRKALVMLQGTLAWRAAYRPERLLAEHGRSLRAEAGSAVSYGYVAMAGRTLLSLMVLRKLKTMK